MIIPVIEDVTNTVWFYIEVNPTMSILIIPAQIQIGDFRYISIYMP